MSSQTLESLNTKGEGGKQIQNININYEKESRWKAKIHATRETNKKKSKIEKWGKEKKNLNQFLGELVIKKEQRKLKNQTNKRRTTTIIVNFLVPSLPSTMNSEEFSP